MREGGREGGREGERETERERERERETERERTPSLKHYGYIHKVNTPCKRLKRHHITHSLPTNNSSIEPVIISSARDYHAPLCHCQSLLFGSFQTPQTLPSERERT